MLVRTRVAVAIGLGIAMVLSSALTLSAHSGELRKVPSATKVSNTEAIKERKKANRYKTSRRHARWGHRYWHLR